MVRKASSKYKRRTSSGHGGEVKEEEVCTEDDIYRILPYPILYHILSFLPTKDVVRTSVLSKRWRYLWTSVPTIDIDDWSLLFGVNWGRFENPEMKDCFMDFVDRVLRLNDVYCLRKFSLKCHEEYEFARVNDLINTVMTRNVEVLQLGFVYEQYAELPPSLLTCGKLVSLKLSRLNLFNVPTSVWLPSLKILHLHCVEFHREDNMKNLLGGCPVLEELDIVSDFFDYDKTFFVRSSSLKSLKIDRKDACDDYFMYSGGVVVEATNLERLDLNCDATEQCDLNGLSSLVEIKLKYGCCALDFIDNYGNKSVDLLRKISNTKYMCLYYCTMEILEHARLDYMPMLNNLTRLELYVHEQRWQVLPYFLECSPNLTTFVFHRVLARTYDERELHQQFREPKCLMLYLKEVQLIRFKGCADEMKMVTYFLKNASLLKKMSIQSYHSGSNNEEILKKLLMFPKSSTACQIAFE